ncbi:MAG: HesA/MoeB/ThiF family protein [Deltaproteobacteria bacterium]|nr:HesA/MoeB/ThiF family protein [Deltaproteobacteria bacterium]
MVKITDNEEYLSQLLKQLVETTGEAEKAIERLVADRDVPKRIAESLACGLNILPKRYEANGGTIGSEGQKYLLLSKVMVVGLGGLGCQVVEQLVRCGVGIVVGVDADKFEETNLNRQLYADLNSIGQKKTEVTQRRVAAINDAVEFHPFVSRVEDLEDGAYQEVDLIFDCLDAIPPRLHLEEVGERLDIPLVHGAIGGWYGQVATVWPGSKMLSTVYGTKQEGIEKTLGNPPFTPAFIAAFMVSEGIKLLLGKKEKENKLMFADLLNNQWQNISL